MLQEYNVIICMNRYFLYNPQMFLSIFSHILNQSSNVFWHIFTHPKSLKIPPSNSHLPLNPEIKAVPSVPPWYLPACFHIRFIPLLMLEPSHIPADRWPDVLQTSQAVLLLSSLASQNSAEHPWNIHWHKVSPWFTPYKYMVILFI